MQISILNENMMIMRIYTLLTNISFKKFFKMQIYMLDGV
jgi:hypothetical protein